MFVLMISGTSSIMGGVGFKSRSLVQSQKNLVYTLLAPFLAQSSSNLLRMLVLMIITKLCQVKLWVGLGKKVGPQVKSLKNLVYTLGSTAIIGTTFLKLGQYVCLDDISVKFKHRWGRVKRQVTRSNLNQFGFDHWTVNTYSHTVVKGLKLVLLCYCDRILPEAKLNFKFLDSDSTVDSNYSLSLDHYSLYFCLNF